MGLLGGEKMPMMAGQALGVRNRDIVSNLKAQRDELIAVVDKIDALLKLLENNPDFVKMVDLARDLI